MRFSNTLISFNFILIKCVMAYVSCTKVITSSYRLLAVADFAVVNNEFLNEKT